MFYTISLCHKQLWQLAGRRNYILVESNWIYQAIWSGFPKEKCFIAFTWPLSEEKTQPLANCDLWVFISNHFFCTNKAVLGPSVAFYICIRLLISKADKKSSFRSLSEKG